MAKSAKQIKAQAIEDFLNSVMLKEGKKHSMLMGDAREFFRIMDAELNGKLSTMILLHTPHD